MGPAPIGTRPGHSVRSTPLVARRSSRNVRVVHGRRRTRSRTLQGGRLTAALPGLATPLKGLAVVGAMVGILWSRAHAVAAMGVESLWNDLQQKLGCSLICGWGVGYLVWSWWVESPMLIGVSKKKPWQYSHPSSAS